MKLSDQAHTRNRYPSFVSALTCLRLHLRLHLHLQLHLRRTGVRLARPVCHRRLRENEPKE